jgi:hypothetical protein
MRTIVFLLCLLLPGVSSAYEVRMTIGGTLQLAGPMPNPQDAVFRVGPNSGAAILEWTVPALTPAQSGQIFSIDENTAPFEWSLLEAAVDDPTGLVFTSYFNIDRTSAWDSDVVMRKVTGLEFHLREFFVSPVGSIASVRHSIVGEGYHIPEPSSVLLLMIAMACHLPYRSHR